MDIKLLSMGFYFGIFNKIPSILAGYFFEDYPSISSVSLTISSIMLPI